MRIGKDGRGQIPRWARKALGIDGIATDLTVMVREKGKTIRLDEDGVLLEKVHRDDEEAGEEDR